jgi:hypothetical protein
MDGLVLSLNHVSAVCNWHLKCSLMLNLPNQLFVKSKLTMYSTYLFMNTNVLMNVQY